MSSSKNEANKRNGNSNATSNVTDEAVKLNVVVKPPPRLIKQKKIRLDAIRNLVFQGGSVKGLSYVGAIGALEKCFTNAKLDFNRNIKNIAGTSAGAITAVGLAVGYKTEELADIMANTNFKMFLSGSNSLVSKDKLLNIENESRTSQSTVVATMVYELNTKFGLFSGQAVVDWLEEIIERKTGIKQMTFMELHELVISEGTKATPSSYKSNFRDIFIVGFNLSTACAQVFSYEDTPNTIITDAVRISMSIPILFLPHYNYIKDENGERKKVNDDLWIDGGLTDNYPVRIFDRNEFNVGTLGFYLVTPQEKDLFEGSLDPHGPTSPTRREIKTGMDYLKALFDSLVSCQQASTHVQSRDPERTIYINNLNISALNFGLSMEEKKSLVESGWVAVMSRMGMPDLPCEISVPTPEESVEVCQKEGKSRGILPWGSKKNSSGKIDVKEKEKEITSPEPISPSASVDDFLDQKFSSELESSENLAKNKCTIA